MTQEAMSRNEWKVYVHIVPKDISNNDENKYYVGITSKDDVRSGDYYWQYLDDYLKENNIDLEKAKSLLIFMY